jgi:hypothetical protein
MGCLYGSAIYDGLSPRAISASTSLGDLHTNLFSPRAARACPHGPCGSKASRNTKAIVMHGGRNLKNPGEL